MDETLAAALACLAARFSFRDFPDFFVIVCRGDLSVIAGPLVVGPGWSRLSDLTPLGLIRGQPVAGDDLGVSLAVLGIQPVREVSAVFR